MPQVPYQAYPTEQPIPGTGARGIGVATPMEAFGGAVAGAVQHLGQVMEHSGNELFARAEAMQDLKNRTEANDLATEAEMAMSDAYTKFGSLEGKNAVAAHGGFNQQLRDIQKDYSGRATNPAVQRMVDQSTKGTMVRTMFTGGRHAATEQKQWTLQSATDAKVMNEKAVLDNPKDDQEFERRRRENDRLTDVVIGVKGLDKVSGDRMKFESNSKLRSNQLDGWIRDDPMNATARVEQYKSQLTDDDYKRLHAQALTKIQQVVPENVAKETYAAGQETKDSPAKTLKEMETEVETRLTKEYPNDPIMAKSGVAAIQRQYNQNKYAEAQETQANIQTLNSAMIESGARTPQELTAVSPKANAAFNALPPSEQAKWAGKLNSYHDQTIKVSRIETENRLLGLRDNDVEAFLNEDILSSPYLTPAEKNHWVGEQQKKMKDRTADPRVRQAQSWMLTAFGTQLTALGLDVRTQDNKDNYDRYSGALQQALEAWKESHGKPASYDEIVKVIGPQVIKQETKLGVIQRLTSGLLGSEKKLQPYFLQEVPEEWATKWKAEQTAAGVTPSDDPEQLRRDYSHWVAENLFGSRAKKAAAIAGPR